MNEQTALYISAITQKIHTTPTCSVTRRNHARNLETSTPAAELAERGYAGCKRCDADTVLLASKLTARTTFSGTCGCGRDAKYTPLPGGYAPRSPIMRVTCSGCGEKVELTADI